MSCSLIIRGITDDQDLLYQKVPKIEAKATMVVMVMLRNMTCDVQEDKPSFCKNWGASYVLLQMSPKSSQRFPACPELQLQ